jgi:DNA polymerase III subunit delta'
MVATSFIGQETAWREWTTAIGSRRMHHAWLLAGARGLGKREFARAAAEALVKQEGAASPAFESHPDILLLDPLPANDDEAKKKADGKPYQTRRNISVDQVRAMIRRLSTKPTLGERRAIVIDPADDMEKGAVNALLKVLEEPPAGTHFLLVAHQPGRLLPTVRSRCRVLRFAPLAPGEIDAVLRRDRPGADAATREAAIAASQGSPGLALSFVEHDLRGLHDLMQRILREGDRDFALRGALAGEVGARPARDRLLAAIELARFELSGALATSGPAQQSRIIESHAALVRLGGQAPTYNFDPGLLIMEIGGLLAAAALPRD